MRCRVRREGEALVWKRCRCEGWDIGPVAPELEREYVEQAKREGKPGTCAMFLYVSDFSLVVGFYTVGDMCRCLCSNCQHDYRLLQRCFK